MYMSKTTRKLKQRISEHRSYIHRNEHGYTVAVHFNDKKHDISTLRFRGIEKLVCHIERNEAYWIFTLQTLFPRGLNHELLFNVMLWVGAVLLLLRYSQWVFLQTLPLFIVSHISSLYGCLILDFENISMKPRNRNICMDVCRYVYMYSTAASHFGALSIIPLWWPLLGEKKKTFVFASSTFYYQTYNSKSNSTLAASQCNT